MTQARSVPFPRRSDLSNRNRPGFLSGPKLSTRHHTSKLLQECFLPLTKTTTARTVLFPPRSVLSNRYRPGYLYSTPDYQLGDIPWNYVRITFCHYNNNSTIGTVPSSFFVLPSLTKNKPVWATKAYSCEYSLSELFLELLEKWVILYFRNQTYRYLMSPQRPWKLSGCITVLASIMKHLDHIHMYVCMCILFIIIKVNLNWFQKDFIKIYETSENFKRKFPGLIWSKIQKPQICMNVCMY